MFLGTPAALYVCINLTILSVLSLPYKINLVYHAVTTTVVLGRNLRALILLLLPFAVIVHIVSDIIQSKLWYTPTSFESQAAGMEVFTRFL